MFWKNVFNGSKKFWRSEEDVAKAAYAAGYSMFARNGNLYFVDEDLNYNKIGSLEELGL